MKLHSNVHYYSDNIKVIKYLKVIQIKPLCYDQLIQTTTHDVVIKLKYFH